MTDTVNDADANGFVLPLLIEIPDDEQTPLQQAMYVIADALRYPVDQHGRVYDVRYLIPILAYHLARTGLGTVDGQAVIKARRVPPAPGVVDDAIEWVALDAPDTVADELAAVTSLDDLAGLSPQARAVAIRDYLGGQPETGGDLADADPWHIQPHITLDD